MKRLLGLCLLLTAGSAAAVPFTITLTNTSPTVAYGWSSGLLTLQPLINIGLTPQPGTPQYFTYTFANSNCNAPPDAFCSGACVDDGNATVRTVGLARELVGAMASRAA